MVLCNHYKITKRVVTRSREPLEEFSLYSPPVSSSFFVSFGATIHKPAFILVLQNVYVNINRIMSVGNRLLESGHYASQQIKQISGQLEKEWKAFAAALDERSTLLEMSASFHQKCDQVRGEILQRRPWIQIQEY